MSWEDFERLARDEEVDTSEGKAKVVREHGEQVRVQMPDGSMRDLPREQVSKVKGDALKEGDKVYNKQNPKSTGKITEVTQRTCRS